MGAAACVLLATGCGRSAFELGEGDGLAACGAEPADGFARSVLEYTPTAGGGSVPLRPDVTDPTSALGPDDYIPDAERAEGARIGTVSLGEGGRLALGFEACWIGTDGGPEPDIVVHEAGFDEQVVIALRPVSADVVGAGMLDGTGYLLFGEVDTPDGAFDLDFALPSPIRFDGIRIEDVPGQGLPTPETPGADIDAVESLAMVDPGP